MDTTRSSIGKSSNDDDYNSVSSSSFSKPIEGLVKNVLEALVSHYQQPIHAITMISLEEEEDDNEYENEDRQKKRLSNPTDEVPASSTSIMIPPVLEFQLRRLPVVPIIQSKEEEKVPVDQDKEADQRETDGKLFNFSSPSFWEIWGHLIQAYGTHIRPLLFQFRDKEEMGQQLPSETTGIPVLTHYELFLSLFLKQQQPRKQTEEDLVPISFPEPTTKQGQTMVLDAIMRTTLERIACDITLATVVSAAAAADASSTTSSSPSEVNKEGTGTINTGNKNTSEQQELVRSSSLSSQEGKKRIRIMMAALIRLMTLVLRVYHYYHHYWNVFQNKNHHNNRNDHCHDALPKQCADFDDNDDSNNGRSILLHREVLRCIVSLLALDDGGEIQYHPPRSMIMRMSLAPADLQTKIVLKTPLIQQLLLQQRHSCCGYLSFVSGKDESGKDESRKKLPSDERDVEENNGSDTTTANTCLVDATSIHLRQAISDFWALLVDLQQEQEQSKHEQQPKDTVDDKGARHEEEEEEEEVLLVMEKSASFTIMRRVLCSPAFDVESLGKAVRAHFFGRDMMVSEETAITSQNNTLKTRLYLGKTVPYQPDPDVTEKPYRKIPSRVHVVWQFVALVSHSNRREYNRPFWVGPQIRSKVWEELVPVFYELLSASSHVLNAVGAAMVHDLVSWCCNCYSNISDGNNHDGYTFWSSHKTSIDNLIGMLDIVAKTCREGPVLAVVTKAMCRLFSLHRNHYRSKRRLACHQWLTILYQNQTRVNSNPLLILGLLVGIIPILYIGKEFPEGVDGADALEVGRLGLSALLPLLGADSNSDWFDDLATTSPESSLFTSQSQQLQLRHEIRLAATVALNNLLIAAHPLVPRHTGKILSHLIASARQICHDPDDNGDGRDHGDSNQTVASTSTSEPMPMPRDDCSSSAELKMILMTRRAVTVHVASTALILCGDKGEQFLCQLEEVKKNGEEDEKNPGSDNSSYHYDDKVICLVRSVREGAQLMCSQQCGKANS